MATGPRRPQKSPPPRLSSVTVSALNYIGEGGGLVSIDLEHPLEKAYTLCDKGTKLLNLGDVTLTPKNTFLHSLM